MAPVAVRAFQTLFAAEFGYVCQTLRRLGVFEADLDDSAQEVFLAVYRKWGDYDPSRPVRPWLVGFAFRVGANARRRRKLAHDEFDETLEGPASSPEERAQKNQATTLALRILQKMGEERRDVFVMHELEDIQAPEIAVILDVPLNTVYSRLRTARLEFEEHAARMVRRSA
jgi:RNA polymerase sigma-70 factor, ECF subfamily